jgi:histone-lysine N-methyltransferase SETMAR
LQESYGELSFGRAYTFRLFKEYKEGREEVGDRRGQFSNRTARTNENIEAMSAIVERDRHVTVRDIALELDLSVGTVFSILHEDLHLSKLVARWVPCLLSEEHKANHLKMAKEFKKSYFEQGEAFLKSLVTMDETWICYSTPELKIQSSEWLPKGSEPPKKAKVNRSEKKVMLIVFFDYEGIIYHHYVPHGTSINSTYYIEVLKKFLDHLRRKRSEKWPTNFLFHQDNARPHVSRQTMEFFEKKGIKLFTHAPYSPDLAPCDFWLFPNIKSELAGRKFTSDIEIKTATEGVTGRLAKDGLLHVFKSWEKRLIKCIEVNGDYVEK